MSQESAAVRALSAAFLSHGFNHVHVIIGHAGSDFATCQIMLHGQGLPSLHTLQVKVILE